LEGLLQAVWKRLNLQETEKGDQSS
jgi:hypothetical protein